MTTHIIIDIALMIWMALAGWGLGTLLFRALRLTNIACGEDIFRLTVGMGMLSHLTLLLGSVLPLTSALTWGLLGAGGLAFLGMLYFERNRLFRRISIHRLDGIELVLIILIVINVVFPLLRNGLMPPLSYDEVAYHLAIPKIYIQQGHITYISYISYSNWPLETEMLYLLGLLAGSELFSHLITWGAMILICLALAVFGSHFFSRKAGLAAALVFSATPMVTSTAGTGLVEVPLTLFIFLSLASFFLWVKKQQPQYYVISAILAGLAASTKMNAVVVAAILGVLVAVVGLWRKEGWKPVVKRFLGFGLVALAVASVWYLKSWIQTGNPFFSFFLNIFPTRDWDALGSTYLLNFITRPNLPLNLQNFFYAFWLISADYAKIGPNSFRLGWVYLASIPIVALSIRFMDLSRRKWVIWLLAVSAILYINWFFQTHQARFFMPAVPLAALIVGACVTSLIERWRHYLFQVGLISGLVGVVLINSWVFQPGEIALLRSNKAYLTGKQDRSQFLSTHTSYFDAFAYANSNFPPNANVLLALWENRGYYLNRPYIWLNPFSQRVVKLEKYNNADQLSVELTHMGFAYILYNPQFTERFISYQYGPYEAQLIQDLLQNHARLIKSFGEIEIYEFIPFFGE